MPALHAYFPTTPERDEAWAFSAVRSRLARDGVETEEKVNPFTKKANLKVVVDAAFHLTVAFESGDEVDADLRSITGRDESSFSRIRVLSGPDPEGEYTDVTVELLDLFDSIGPVLVYGVDAESVFADTLAPGAGQRTSPLS